MFHLGVGRSQIEWKLKAKTQISVFPWAKIGQNDHSNPYIESTTVLSDEWTQHGLELLIWYGYVKSGMFARPSHSLFLASKLYVDVIIPHTQESIEPARESCPPLSTLRSQDTPHIVDEVLHLCLSQDKSGHVYH